jgi:hypothetical protein
MLSRQGFRSGGVHITANFDGGPVLNTARSLLSDQSAADDGNL